MSYDFDDYDEDESTDVGAITSERLNKKLESSQAQKELQDGANRQALNKVGAGRVNAPETPQPQQDEQGVLDDMLTGLTQGLTRGIGEIPQSAIDIIDWISPDTVDDEWIDGGVVDAWEEGVTSFLETSAMGKIINASGTLVGDDGTLSERIENEEGPSTTAGKLTEGIAQFVPAFYGLGKFTKMVGWGNKFIKNHKWVYEASRGAAADLISVDPNEERISNLAAEFELTKPIADILGTNTNDSAAVGRVKAAVEGAIIGESLGVLATLARKAWSHKYLKEANRKSLFTDTPADNETVELVHGTFNEVIQARGAVDDMLTMLEWWRRFDEAAPGVRALRKVLQANENLPVEEASEKALKEQVAELSQDSRDLFEVLEIDVGQGDSDSLMEAFERRLGAAGEQTPMSRLKEFDAETAGRVSAYIDSQNIQINNQESLEYILSEARKSLVGIEERWREVVLSDDFKRIDADQREDLLTAAYESVRSPSQGFRTIGEVEESYRLLSAALGKDHDPLQFNEQIRELAQRDPRIAKEGTGTAPAVVATKTAFGRVKLTTRQINKAVSAIRAYDTDSLADTLVDPTKTDDLFWKNMFREGDDSFANTFSSLAQFVDNSLSNMRVKGSGNKNNPDAVTRADTEREARKILKELGNPDDGDLRKAYGEVLGPGADQSSDHAKVLATRTLLTAVNRRIQYLATKADGNLKAQYDLVQASKFHSALYDLARARAANMGRAMNAMRYTSLELPDKELHNIILGTVGNPKKLVKRIADFKGQALPDHELHALFHDGKDFFPYWLNWLLSSPVTHAVNISSAKFMMGYTPAVRMIAHSLRGQWKDAGLEFEKIWRAPLAAREGFKAAAKAYRTGAGRNSAVPGLQEVGYLGKKAAQMYQPGVEGQSAAYHVARGLDSSFGVFGKLLVSEDEYAKAINYSVESRRLAKKYLYDARPDLEGDEFDAEVAKMVSEAKRWREFSNVSDSLYIAKLKEIDKISTDYAATQTFTQNVGDGSLGVIGEAARATPFGRWIAPFVRTPTNLMRLTASHIPGLDRMIKRERDIIKNADPQLLMEKRVQYAVALGAMMTVGEMVDKGLITGAPPPSGQRTTWDLYYKPGSIRIGTNDDESPKWVQYDRLLPVGGWLYLAATFVSTSSDMAEEDVEDIGTALMASTIKLFSNMTFVRGVFDFTNAVSDPNRAGYYVSNFAGTLVPFSSLAYKIRQVADPNVRNTRSATEDLAIIDRALNVAMNKIPGLSEYLPPVMNVFNEPVLKPMASSFNFANPFYTVDAETNPSLKKLADLGANINMRSFRRHNRTQLTPEQENEWIRLTANDGRLKDALIWLVEQPSFDALPTEESKREAIEDIVRSNKSAAWKVLLRNDPELTAKKSLEYLDSMERSGRFTQKAIDTLRASLEG